MSLRSVSMRGGQETQLADTLTPVVEKSHSRSPLMFLEQPHPLSRTERDFWSAGKSDIPSFGCNPWDFYEKFLELKSGTILVVGNDRSTVRAIQECDVVRSSGEHDVETATLTYQSLLSIRHPNFVDVCESYVFESQVFVITEYVGFCLDDILQRSLRLSEPEIAYVISQVLAGIIFIWSRKLEHPRISTRNVFISPNGEVKIDPTDFPSSDGQSSRNMECLKTLMLRMMHATNETVKNLPAESCSAEAVSFMAATSWASPSRIYNSLFEHCDGPEASLCIV
ncbi:p21 protein (Cdc42 Rac)-activated kinase [Pseudogymnoascus destructans]|uniref:p21 protein (Cdc42 Rac)-activated kinase n=1 Tax=Pseudogymnoascus destructans TaxID=655981 RepID=A0A177ADR3_9PEZI|nr:p21 protein (Cdc42 Rac)-activated kinase [Pseudogymnoascus destructans]OAF59411.1 p21 protein (Cdc42 Rac)-activated kinase [Pseudogymnoascus destructans]